MYNSEHHNWKTNRIKKKSSNSGLYWCQCDLNHVSDQGKCKVCGCRNGKFKEKHRDTKEGLKYENGND